MHFKDPVDSLQSVSVLWNGFELNITLLSIYPSIHSSIYPSTYPTNMAGPALGARESWKNADYCGVDKLTNCPIEWSDKSSGGVCPRGSELSVKNLALWPIREVYLRWYRGVFKEWIMEKMGQREHHKENFILRKAHYK